MTDRPGDGPALEAEPIEVEAVANGPPAGEPAAGPEERTVSRRRRRRRLFLLLWFLPVVLILAVGYLVAAQPERVAAFLAGKPPDMATAGDIERLTDRLLKIEVESADMAQVDAHSAAITANREKNEAVAGEVAALHNALEGFEERLDARLEALEERISNLEGAEPATDPAVAAQMAGLEERLAGLEARPAGDGKSGTGADPALATLKAAVAALEMRLEGLAAGGEADSLEAQVTATNRAAAEAGAAAGKALEELASLRDAVANLARSGEAGATVKLAVARLRIAVDSEVPFKEELVALQASGSPGFGAWTARAERGLPTEDGLARQFKQLARARVVGPEGVTGTPWLDDAIDRLSDVVSVRRVAKDLPGDGPDAVLGRAEAYIEEGDLAGAVAELGSEAPPPFDGWLAVARDRLAADAELEAFTARAGR